MQEVAKMKSIVLMLSLFAAVPPAAAEEPEVVRARAAYALASAKPRTLADAAAASVRRNVPLIVFVGQDCRRPEGCECETVRVERFEDDGGVRVVVGFPQDGKIRTRSTAPGTPSEGLIRAMAHDPVK
jgi:hypothetical protein